MIKSKVVSYGIVVAVALVILANAPAILMDPLTTAVAQIRWNAATTLQPGETGLPVSGDPATSAKRTK